VSSILSHLSLTRTIEAATLPSISQRRWLKPKKNSENGHINVSVMSKQNKIPLVNSLSKYHHYVIEN
jgi:hypothetical protein